MMNDYFSKVLSGDFDEARARVTEALKKEGFGILMEIDIQAKMKEKLGIDFKRYMILGACSPPNAYRALQAEENIGLMLPCNVIVYEKDGKTVVSVIKPTVAMQMIQNEELGKIAREVEDQLKRAFDSMK
jgi:uncharacterized protein (DUF302 family)